MISSAKLLFFRSVLRGRTCPLTDCARFAPFLLPFLFPTCSETDEISAVFSFFFSSLRVRRRRRGIKSCGWQVPFPQFLFPPFPRGGVGLAASERVLFSGFAREAWGSLMRSDAALQRHDTLRMAAAHAFSLSMQTGNGTFPPFSFSPRAIENKGHVHIAPL